MTIPIAIQYLQGRIWLDRYGSDDGDACACDDPDHYFLSDLSEIYHQRRSGRSCKRVTETEDLLHFKNKTDMID